MLRLLALTLAFVACKTVDNTEGSTGITDADSTSPDATTEATSDMTTDAPTGEECAAKFAEEPHVEFAGEPAVIPLRIEAAAPVSLPGGSRIHFVLYGYDQNWADFTATVVRSHVQQIDALPFELELTLPNPPHERIPAAEADAKYYLIVEIDTNGDDCVTVGDYTIDYDKLEENLNVTFPAPETVIVPVQKL